MTRILFLYDILLFVEQSYNKYRQKLKAVIINIYKNDILKNDNLYKRS